MGQSTNAILFYGYAWDDEDTRQLWRYEGGAEESVDDDDEESDDHAGDWEDRWAALHGVDEPTEPYGEEPSGVETPARLKHQAYWKAKSELVEACPIEIDTHCSCESPMWLVAVKATMTTAHRGFPARPNFIVPLGADEQLADFMAKMGIPKPKGQDAPAWWLVSDWC